VGLLFGFVGMIARAEDLRPGPVPAAPSTAIAETQLTLRLDPFRGRGTVVSISDETLTVVTAAHVVDAEDVGKTVLISQQRRLRGRVVAVARNPLFRPVRSRYRRELSADRTLGVDTAVVAIAVDLHDASDRLAFKRIKAADLTPQTIPGRPDQVLPVRIVDQDGEEHVVRVGNHLNPKCLAWGRGNFDTKPGDSGAGVFLVRKSPAGEPSPVLIGVVSQTDERGAIASLVHRDEPWIEDSLARPQAGPR